MSGTYQCFHCLSNSVVWDSDFDFSDFGYDGEGIVHICHCANCGAEIEYRVSCDNEKEQTDDSEEDEEDEINHIYYTHCLRCGKELHSEESRRKGYGKICERKAKCEKKLELF